MHVTSFYGASRENYSLPLVHDFVDSHPQAKREAIRASGRASDFRAKVDVVRTAVSAEVIEFKQRIEKECTWLSGLYDISEEDFSSVNVYPLVNAIPELFESKRFELVDRILNEVDYSRLSVPFMVSLLRVTSSGKEHLKQWKPSLTGVQVILENNGLDANRHLRGMIGARG